MATLTKNSLSSTKERATASVQTPINLENWIEENKDLFKPPVSNRYLYDGRDFFVMDIKVRIREGDKIVDHLVREGETFFIPPNVPHAPVRPPDTIGVVVERRRPPGEHEHVIFYCDNCGAVVEDIDFDCGDIVEHFSRAMKDFWADDSRRTCKKCGHKVPTPEPVRPFKK
jgi:3-hydroxyanthranilate 3,4-dioxygenase